jgi:spermidine synthase
VIDLGYKYFNLSAYKKLTLYKDEALHFIQTCWQKFDLVVVDIFIDDQTPDAFSELSFIQSLKSVIPVDGTVLINRMITSKKTEQQTLDLMEYIKKEFGNIEVLRFDNGGSNNWMLLNK